MQFGVIFCKDHAKFIQRRRLFLEEIMTNAFKD